MESRDIAGRSRDGGPRVLWNGLLREALRSCATVRRHAVDAKVARHDGRLDDSFEFDALCNWAVRRGMETRRGNSGRSGHGDWHWLWSGASSNMDHFVKFSEVAAPSSRGSLPVRRRALEAYLDGMSNVVMAYDLRGTQSTTTSRSDAPARSAVARYQRVGRHLGDWRTGTVGRAPSPLPELTNMSAAG